MSNFNPLTYLPYDLPLELTNGPARPSPAGQRLYVGGPGLARFLYGLPNSSPAQALLDHAVRWASPAHVIFLAHAKKDQWHN
jgi:hypothetical protein